MAGLSSWAGHPPNHTSGTAMFIIGLVVGVLLGVTLTFFVFSLLLWALQEKGVRPRRAPI